MDREARVPDRFQSRTGLAFAFDTNFVDDTSTGARVLRRQHREGWINLTRSDTLVTELLGARDDQHREELIEVVSEYVETHGAAVWGHSQWGGAEWATKEDVERLATVFEVLHPGSSMEKARKQHVRDAMHVATAIRYGLNGFITHDKKILSKRMVIRERFDGFLVCDPVGALAVSVRFEERARIRDDKTQS